MIKHYPEEFNYLMAEGNINANHIKAAELILTHRCGNVHDHIFDVMGKYPQTEKRPCIINDMDDNEFNLPKTHPMREMWYEAGKDQMAIRQIKKSDWSITTGQKLLKTFKQLNSNVSIFRNMFDWELPQWNLDIEKTRDEMLGREFYQGKVIIGWAGLTSHFADLKRMHVFLKYIHDLHPNAVFVIAGMALRDNKVEIIIDQKTGQRTMKEQEITDYKETYKYKVEQLFSDFDQNRLKIFKALPLEEYGKFYTLFDISLAYIEHNAFSSAKSEIKCVESMKYKAIPIFSLWGGYQDMCELMPKELRHQHIAISTEFPKRWVDAISYWIEHREEAQKVAQELCNWAVPYYNLNEHIYERVEFFRQRIEEHSEEEILRVKSLLN